MRCHLVTVLFLIFSTFLYSQEEEVIEWTPNLKLSWADFKGQIDPESGAAATTASGISYEYTANFIGDLVEVDIEVNTYFYPNESWYRPEVCDAQVLQHEQLHFDISELFARKFREELNRTTFTKKVKSEISKIYKSIIKELAAYQDLYDLETNFSIDNEAQQKWNKKVEVALKKQQ